MSAVRWPERGDSGNVNIPAGVARNGCSRLACKISSKFGEVACAPVAGQLDDPEGLASRLVVGVAHSENDVNITGTINGDAGWSFGPAAARVCRIRHLWIDDQRARVVIVPDFDSDFSAALHESPVDSRSAPVMILINDRPMQLQITAFQFNLKIARIGNLQTLLTTEIESDGFYITARGGHEIEFQRVAFASECHIDVWIDMSIDHTAVVFDICEPVFAVSAVIVRSLRQLFHRFDCRRTLAARKSHLDRFLSDMDHNFVLVEVGGVTSASGYIADTCIGLHL